MARQATPEGDAIIAEELASAATADPPPADAPFALPDETESAGNAKPRRGRPVGSKNSTGRRSKASKLEDLRAALDTAIQRGSLLASYAVMQAPIPPERKVVWIGDAEIIGRPKGREALAGAVVVACERNAKFEKFALRLMEASAYTGIGASIIFGLALPIMANHGMFSNLPPAMQAMLADEDVDAPAGFEGSE